MALSFYFVRENNTISKIMADITKATWERLKQEYMPVPNEDYGTNAHHFCQRWNLPNCMGEVL
jgi:hypothetical protein